jgi:hypothetical protein
MVRAKFLQLFFTPAKTFVFAGTPSAQAIICHCLRAIYFLHAPMTP